LDSLFFLTIVLGLGLSVQQQLPNTLRWEEQNERENWATLCLPVCKLFA